MKINVCCTLFPAGGVENVTTNIRYLTGTLFNILIKISDFFFVKTILGKLRRQITKEKSSKRCRRKSSAVKTRKKIGKTFARIYNDELPGRI